MESGATTAFARVLSSGNCRHLQQLDLEGAFYDHESLTIFLESISSVSFPDMCSLELGKNDMDEQHAVLFGEVLKAGAFPRLQRLRVGEQRVYRSVWEALEAGSCPGLRELRLADPRLDGDSATALASALVSGSLNNLQCLALITKHWDDEGWGDSDADVAGVVNALSSSCHDLRRLGLSLRGTDEEARKALWSALREEKWPKLHSFSIWSSDEAVRELAVLLEQGAGANLQDMGVAGGSMAGLVELVRILREGACPKLRRLIATGWGRGMNEEERQRCRDDLRASLRERGIMLFGGS